MGEVVRFLGGVRDRDVQKLEHMTPLFGREAAPETKKGQFVGIINELARSWAARRPIPAQKVIDRNAEEYGEGAKSVSTR